MCQWGHSSTTGFKQTALDQTIGVLESGFAFLETLADGPCYSSPVLMPSYL